MNFEKVRILKSAEVGIACYDKQLYLSKTYQYLLTYKLTSSLVSHSH